MKTQTQQAQARTRLLKSIILFIFLGIVVPGLFPAWGYSQSPEVSNYPIRPINWIIPLPPGGTVDLAVRLLASRAEKYLGQPIVPINKPGGAMTIGVAAVASAKPDGYTIGNFAGGNMFVAPFLEKIPYHPVKDLTPIMQFAEYNMGVIVKQESQFKTFKDLVDYARQNPKKLTWGAVPVSLVSLTTEQIFKQEGVQLTHIPFKGAPEIQVALLGEHLAMGATDFNYALVEGQKIRLLLLLREKKSSEYPQTPVIRDLGYNFPVPLIVGIAGPKDMPDKIVAKLENAFSSAMKEPEFIKGMQEIRLSVGYRNSKELKQYVSSNYNYFGSLLKQMGLIK